MTVRDWPLSDVVRHAYGSFITEQTGMRLDPERWPELQGTLPAWGVAAPVAGRAVVQALARQLSVGETYFFREPAAFDLLEHELLPALVAERRRSTRRLRLWSAGCCTGEEAYSLAIVLRRLIPDIADWDVAIVGTDIHPGFLAAARAGVYGDWSFRGVPAALRETCFRPCGAARHAVLPELRRLTRFRFGNLAQDEVPGAGFDLVLCRHVLMYFDARKAQQAIGRLQAALGDGGWLLLGATESTAADHPSLQALRFGDTTIHCKRAAGAAPEVAKRTRAHTTHDTAARVHDAITRCRAAIAADTCDPVRHLRHALLLEQLGRVDEARAALRRALFLDARLAAAQAALVRLNAGRGRCADALRRRRLHDAAGHRAG
ncbi:MAG TPA: CheR family methyltransferase [Albitalea sp.]